MSDPLTIDLSRPITSVQILGNHPTPGGRGGKLDTGGAELSSPNQTDGGVNAEQTLTQDLETQKAVLLQACRALDGVVAKLNQFCERIFVEQREEVARLSVEIARKILVQKVEEGDYQIESIVEEALKNVPSRQDVVVHLHPEDLAQFQKAQQAEPSSTFAGIKFVSDPNIGRAECTLESPKGIIESLINEHIERIGKALKKAE